jgi:hypothetical protein
VTYILTKQIYDEVTGHGAYARYLEYLESVRGQLPAGAYALATSDWYFNSDDHRAPHDAWLERVTVEEVRVDGEKQPTLSIAIRLLGAYHDGWIDLRYHDVSRYRIELEPSGLDRGQGHRDWRHDEFRLAAGGRVEHEIEWWGIQSTGTWLIEAADVEFHWTPRASVPEGLRSST